MLEIFQGAGRAVLVGGLTGLFLTACGTAVYVLSRRPARTGKLNPQLGPVTSIAAVIAAFGLLCVAAWLVIR